MSMTLEQRRESVASYFALARKRAQHRSSPPTERYTPPPIPVSATHKYVTPPETPEAKKARIRRFESFCQLVGRRARRNMAAATQN